MYRKPSLIRVSLVMLPVFGCGVHPQGVHAQQATTSTPAAAVQSSPTAATGAESWAALQPLVGRWLGSGSDEDATATGETVFQWEAGHQILVRRDHTQYKAGTSHPAFVYEALMVIYKDSRTGLIRADYFDSGSHQIHYDLVRQTSPDTVQFQSEGDGGPLFRLTYKRLKPADMSVTFEMSPPGPAAYHTVATGVVHKAL